MPSKNMMSDDDLFRISKQHASAAAIQVASGEAFSSQTNPDLQIAEQYMSLGKALKLKGDHPAAIQEMKKALQIRRKVLGKDHPETGRFFCRWLTTHVKKLSWIQLPLSPFYLMVHELLESHSQHFFQNFSASTYYQLGICYTQAKEYDHALTELKRALTLGRLCWGKTHEDTGEYHITDITVTDFFPKIFGK